MKPLQVNDVQIEMIRNESFDSHFWFYQLGISISAEEVSTENRFSYDFYKHGKDFWEQTVEKIKDLLCNRKEKVPNPSLDEFLDGDIRNLIVYLLTLLVANLDIVISVAIPLVALVLKLGLKEFCARS